MKSRLLNVVRFHASLLLLVVAVTTVAQSFPASTALPQMYEAWLTRSAPDLSLARNVAGPLMSPELVLVTYEGRIVRQADTLTSYTASTVVQADLPDALQQGQFEVRTKYVAPRTLRFTAVRFAGDPFVKSNVINRILQSEVQHVESQDRGNTAIDSTNYSFTYKRTESIGLRLVRVYAVKPRQKRAGLFKGEIYLDATTGSLRQAKGKMAKSPSFFIRKIEFAQEYADFKGFTVPVHLHSVAKARVLGRVVVDIFVYDYSLLAQNTAATDFAP